MQFDLSGWKYMRVNSGSAFAGYSKSGTWTREYYTSGNTYTIAELDFVITTSSYQIEVNVYQAPGFNITLYN